MTSHLTLPYSWVECADSENCQEHVHQEETADTMNSYPLSWVEELFSCKITGEGTIFYDNAGNKHNNNGPAVIYNNGILEWWQHGERHRDNGPAFRYKDKDFEWWQNGLLHRVDGPAVEYANGNKQWWLNGQRHREDGPAVIKYDGTREWWIHGIQQPTPANQETGTE